MKLNRILSGGFSSLSLWLAFPIPGNAHKMELEQLQVYNYVIIEIVHVMCMYIIIIQVLQLVSVHLKECGKQ